ncbi:adenylosuccinate lyase family protein [Halomonas sp. McH1-25]|uniref:class-II fumarase/aspartase family protein n=1 Tax=unclassified Halomonas TaxID=2609666 RepID=UPI001EF55081|nr:MULTISPECIES: adenylosuccinate lyase family protein [unclassified Halomonas]MCG7602228.1 adenylosuccinate lyase family protein [Halomonas sp. McH1-25]MCP1344444.1 adenylosuccinate lyase family protein [Halomonas sp. FL8]MCP1362469.1 adenylosuccinate lyase family protein [Halomonas sp. BBD45]
MYDLLLRQPFMSETGMQAIRAQALVAAMREVELALAAEQEARGLLPEGTVKALQTHLDDHAFDMQALAEETAKGGNAAIPFVKQAKAALPDELKRHFHKGATSQDIVDSALMLVLKPRLERCLSLLAQARTSGCTLMQTHRGTAMVGRTLMQQALPITFGAKVANWLWGLHQAERRLDNVVASGLYVQLGGAVGVHSGLDEHGLPLMDGLAARLGLNAPLLPWHTDRQPILALAGALDAVAAGADKIALDVSLLCQTEVGELSEPAEAGVGESSSMPHKRNPVACARIRAAARQVHGNAGIIANAAAQPLERGLGEWHAEWAPLVDSVLLLEGALETLTALLDGLEVHSEAMQRNLAVTGGAIMAEPAARVLVPAVGSDAAKRIARESSETARVQGRPYADVLLEHAEVAGKVDEATLRDAVRPELYIGSSLAQVERALNVLR